MELERDRRPYQTSDCASVPAFAREFTLVDGYLVLTRWVRYSVSVQGKRSDGYQLRAVGTAKVTKRGTLGAIRGEDGASADLYDAFRLWVEDGKPSEWTRREW